MRAIKVLLGAAALGVLVSVVSADEVIFSNGDKLSGTIKTMDAGKLVVGSKVAGDVTVDMKDVKTFSSDGPVEIKLKDGTVIKQKVVAGDAGTVKIADGGPLAAQAVALANVTQINPPKPEVKWTGAIVAGGLLTRGNTNTESANVAIDLMRRAEKDRITLGAAYLYGRQENPDTGEKTTTTDNWFLFAKYDYFFTPKVYGYLSNRLEHDEIALLNLRETPSAGIGYQWVESKQMNFFTEAGIAWVYEDFKNVDETEEHFAARVAYHFDYNFNDKVALGGWYNGDFNYSGQVDANDYFLIDKAFAQQGTPLAAGRAKVAQAIPRHRHRKHHHTHPGWVQ
jgi:putative salt-induced outer membrane protein YdiY